MEDEEDEFLIEIEAEYRLMGQWDPFDPPPVGSPPFHSRR